MYESNNRVYLSKEKIAEPREMWKWSDIWPWPWFDPNRLYTALFNLQT